MWAVVYYAMEPASLAGWYVVDFVTRELLQGPYGTHGEAAEAINTRAHRLAQGWKP